MRTILHLEQSELIRKMVKNILSEKGFWCIQAETAEEAYSLLKAKLDLIITSTVIPDDTIENFLKKINHTINKDTPVFVITGSAMDDTKKKMLNLGVTDYITKENIATHLLTHVEQVLEDHDLTEIPKDISVAILDDNRLEREIQKNILVKNGVTEVDCYDSGQALLNAGKGYDAYLIDVVLNQEFGKDIIPEIRKKSMKSAIIVVSAVTNPKTLGGILHAGANDFIAKPVDPNILITKLNFNIRNMRT